MVTQSEDCKPVVGRKTLKGIEERKRCSDLAEKRVKSVCVRMTIVSEARGFKKQLSRLNDQTKRKRGAAGFCGTDQV